MLQHLGSDYSSSGDEEGEKEPKPQLDRGALFHFGRDKPPKVAASNPRKNPVDVGNNFLQLLRLHGKNFRLIAKLTEVMTVTVANQVYKQIKRKEKFETSDPHLYDILAHTSRLDVAGQIYELVTNEEGRILFETNRDGSRQKDENGNYCPKLKLVG